jgi:hypothetical protein
MTTSMLHRTGILLVTLALAAACGKSPEPANKTASADKRTAGDKAERDGAQTKTKGGGGSDEVDATTPTQLEDDEPPEEDELASYDPRVAQAAKVAREISNDPQSADEVLEAEDLDREKLDALMYEIANDPDLTEQYRVARGL